MLLRYTRQKVLDEIGEAGQKKLGSSNVLIIGLGALGTVTAQLLVRSGVNVFLVDHDVVELVNLQRQLLYDEDDVGKKKVRVCIEKLRRINSEVSVDGLDVLVTEESKGVFDGVDLVLDCTDTMRTRHVINDICQEKKVTWIYCAASTTKGNVLVVDDHDVFRRLFKSGETFDACSEVGVVNALTTVMAGVQVTEALKYLLGQTYCSDLIRFDIWKNRYETIKVD